MARGRHVTDRAEQVGKTSMHVVCFILGNSPASEFYMPTFWNTVCSETSAYKIQAPGNYPEDNIQHTEHGESLKSRIT